jgi:DNA replication and repair protein RecF
MRLVHLSLAGFRNYETLEMSFTEGHHLLLGRNGEGKTNLLEAIHLLGTGTSMRGARDALLVKHGQTGFRVGARLEDPENDRSVRAEVLLDRGAAKRIRLNKEPARASDLLAVIKVVSFSPADVELVQGSGRVRRRFLDLIGCQLSPEYLQVLRDYQRAVKQRNETLARSFVHRVGRSAAAEAREPWTDRVVELGADLFRRRRQLTHLLGERLRALTREAFRGAGPVDAAYRPGVPWSGEDPTDDLAEALVAAAGKDEALGYTSVGPHTDDLQLDLGGSELRRYGSLGQQQLGAMFLKLTQADLVRTQVGAPPLLLVDEMFAILDRRAAEEFLERVESEGQIFLATAQEGWLGELRERGFRVHRVTAGTVESEG